MKKLLQANTASGRRRVSEVFRDFCELSAITIRNTVDPTGWDAREARYHEIAQGYSREEFERFPQVLAELTLELEKGLSDVLGKLYMSLDLGNEVLGQFFTPFEVSIVMAKMTVGELPKQLAAGKEFITVQEPACGSGGMILAMADTLRDEGINYQRKLHVTATDLDSTAVHMAYVQTSLAFIPALIVHGNTLTLEQFDVWPTPAHVLGGWNSRLTNEGSTPDDTVETVHVRRGMGADDYCTCDGPWPCPEAPEAPAAA
jgi:hypothetical protein